VGIGRPLIFGDAFVEDELPEPVDPVPVEPEPVEPVDVPVDPEPVVPEPVVVVSETSDVPLTDPVVLDEASPPPQPARKIERTAAALMLPEFRCISILR